MGSGSADALTDFYEATYVRLVGVVSLAAGTRAEGEEVVQEAFVRLIGRWQQVSEYDDPEAWVRKVAFRLLSNRRRSASRALRRLARHDHVVAPEPPPGSDRIDIDRALATLPLGQRQVIVLHHLLALDVQAVADVLGISVGTVKSRLSRGRAALAPLLKEGNAHV